MSALRSLAGLLFVAFLLASGMQSVRAAEDSPSTTDSVESAAGSILKRFESFASPGPLSRVHQDLDRADSCVRCHGQNQGLDQKLCLSCHKEIAQRLDLKSGFHGKLEGACQTCHVEHKGKDAALIKLDRAAFDHSKAVFPLADRHRQLKCEECHATKGAEQAARPVKFIGLPVTCEGCHQTPHKNEFIDRCDRCHSEKGWKRPELKFNHDTATTFTLTGAHQKLDCAACHSGMKVFNQAPNRCADCHQDPHKGQFAAKQCDACHQTSGFQTALLKFNHDRDTAFALTGKHQQLSCEQCHQQGVFRLAKTSCAQCHEDPHRAALGPNCATCHSTAGFDAGHSSFDHNRQAGFALTGHHAQIACSSCHADRTFAAKGKTCSACHDDPHRTALGPDCTKCHSMAGFDSARLAFDHDRQTPFALTGLHAAVTCAACHEDRTFGVKGKTCTGCHADVEAFYGGKSPVAAVAAKPDPMHGKVTCAQCHAPSDRNGSLASVEPHCLECHNEHYAEFLEDAAALNVKTVQSLRRSDLKARREDGIKLLDQIGRLAPHNFGLAKTTLEQLGAKP